MNRTGESEPGRGLGWLARAGSIRDRDGHSCRRCGKSEAENNGKLSVDHVIPWRLFANKELANSPVNLVSLCRSCHSWKTSRAEKSYLVGDRHEWGLYIEAVGLKGSVGLSTISEAMWAGGTTVVGP